MSIRKTASGRLTELDQMMSPTIAGAMQPGETLGPGLKRLAASVTPPDPAAYWSAADERELAAEDLDG